MLRNNAIFVTEEHNPGAHGLGGASTHFVVF